MSDVFDQARTLVITRHFAAPRALVFRMWAEGEHINRWCSPKDFSDLGGSADFRAGGAWSARFRSPAGTDYRMRGVYREIVTNERIVFTHTWVDEAGETGHETLVTIELEDEGDGTRMTFTQAVFETESVRDSHRGGWSEAFDNLEAYLQCLTETGETI